jgi:hypothetical protein
MKNVVDWADRPLWVRVGLFGIRRRKVAMGWMYGGIALAIVHAVGFGWLVWGGLTVLGVAGGALMGGFLVGGFLGLILGSFWYLLAIQWADEHEGWSRLPAR